MVELQVDVHSKGAIPNRVHSESFEKASDGMAFKNWPKNGLEPRDFLLGDIDLFVFGQAEFLVESVNALDHQRAKLKENESVQV